MPELSAIHPYFFPELFESIWLGNMKSPGVVTLSGHDRNENWDVQEAKGTEGASSVLGGRPLGEFQASFYLAGDEDDAEDVGSNDFDRWELFKQVVDSTVAGPAPMALPVFHPDLARNGFTEVVSAGVGGLIWDERGGATVLVKFREHKPPKPKPAKKSGSRGTGASPGAAKVPEKPDPNAAAKRELAGLVEEAKRP